MPFLGPNLFAILQHSAGHSFVSGLTMEECLPLVGACHALFSLSIPKLNQPPLLRCRSTTFLRVATYVSLLPALLVYTQWCNTLVFRHSTWRKKEENFFIAFYFIFVCLFFRCRFFTVFRFITPPPPHVAEGRETKKRTTLARLLKGLKTVNRRDRTNNQNSQTQARVSKHVIFTRFFSSTFFGLKTWQMRFVSFSLETRRRKRRGKRRNKK